MLIHPWDASLGTEEWQEWLAGSDRFGVLAVNNARSRAGAGVGAHALHCRRRG